MQYVTLNNGLEMPQLGLVFGRYRMRKRNRLLRKHLKQAIARLIRPKYMRMSMVLAEQLPRVGSPVMSCLLRQRSGTVIRDMTRH